MELKRYVMSKITKRLYEYEKQDGNFVDFYKGVHESDKAFIIYADDLTDNYKTSNNILDLVEVGDLVEYRNKIGECSYEYKLFRIDALKKTYQNGENRIFFEGVNGFCSDKQVLTFYKRQPNGDYKKYEVKA